MTDSPFYRTIVALKEVAYENDYPKNKERFIWGIPSKYENFCDREISAFCSCWIYDFTLKSFEAAKRIDNIMGESPYKFIWNRQFDYFIMEANQKETLYMGIRMSDVYMMFDSLHKLIRRYSSIKGALSCSIKETPYDTVLSVLSVFRQFNGKNINSQGRINLFLFMMVHCFDDYDFDSSKLQAPIFNHRILPSCRTLHLINKKVKTKDFVDKITSQLQWISKKNPMTFWVGIVAYYDYIKEYPKKAKQFASMRLIRHPYRKR